MPGRYGFEYAVIRAVPRVERDEFINVGVIVFARAASYLDCAIRLDEGRLRALYPGADVATIARHLEAMRAVCAGDEAAGPIARLPQSERFHFLVATRSTVIQASPVHGGASADLPATLQSLFKALVLS